MTQAVNLANFANYLDSSGGMSPSALNAATPVSKGGTGATSFASGSLLKGNGSGAVSTASATDIVGQIGATPVNVATNATILQTANFSISEIGGILTIKYGSTPIVQILNNGSILSVGSISAAGNVTGGA